MKFLFVLCGFLLVTLAVHGRPVCEECDGEEAPLAIPDENVLRLVKAAPIKLNTEETEPEEGIEETNIIDAPVVCPEGQKPDHNGKCRPVWNG